MADDQSLMALSPLDGRYREQSSALRQYFSEFAYIKYRVIVELHYLEWLSKKHIVRPLTAGEKRIGQEFSLRDARRIKEIEGKTKHDVKAIEYFLKEKLKRKDLGAFVHFGLTSDDTNNLAYGLMLTGATRDIIAPQLTRTLALLKESVKKHSGDVMLALTHGQPATPTTYGKEIAVYFSRLARLASEVENFRFEGKLNGAVGNYNALEFAYPGVNWVAVSKSFISSLGLIPNLITTQILPADNWIEYFMRVYQVNAILIGLCQDMWFYVSRGLLRLVRDPQQVGSSTMPQKVNPIDFENAEGNLQAANATLEFFMRKLPVSRLQRDLSDSTVKRMIGSALAYSLVAWKSLERGLGKVSFDRAAALEELGLHWEVLAEAIQIYLKIHGDEKGYEKVKSQVMGKRLNKETYLNMVKEYPELAKLTPAVYIGLAEKLAKSSL